MDNLILIKKYSFKKKFFLAEIKKSWKCFEEKIIIEKK